MNTKWSTKEEEEEEEEEEEKSKFKIITEENFHISLLLCHHSLYSCVILRACGSQLVFLLFYMLLLCYFWAPF